MYKLVLTYVHSAFYISFENFMMLSALSSAFYPLVELLGRSISSGCDIEPVSSPYAHEREDVYESPSHQLETLKSLHKHSILYLL